MSKSTTLPGEQLAQDAVTDVAIARQVNNGCHVAMLALVPVIFEGLLLVTVSPDSVAA